MASFTVANPITDKPLSLLTLVQAMTAIQSRGVTLERIELTKAEIDMLRAHAVPGASIGPSFMGVPVHQKES